MVSSDKYQAVHGDVRQGVQVKAIDRGYLSFPIEPPTKTASWENLNELELLNSAGGTLQGTQLPSTAHMSFSNGMGCLSMCNMDSRENQMGTYISCNNVQGEAMQTLHLMNPLYSGHGNYASHADMVLVHDAAAAVGQDDPVSRSLQQHYFSFSSSPALTQGISHQSTINSVHSTALVPKSNLQQTSLLLGGLGSNTWGAVNELSFLPLNDTARLTQPLEARLACMEPGQQQPSSSLSQLILRPEPEEQGSMFHHGIALGLTADNPRPSPGPNQGLSLSLSAHGNPFQLQCFGMQPAATLMSNSPGLLQGLSEEGSRDDGYSQRWVGTADRLKVNSHNNNHFLPACRLSGLDPTNKQLPLEIISQAAPVFRGYLTGSKYLKAAQVLLEDVVGQGCGMKNNSKHTVLQSWIGGGSLLDSSTSRAGHAACETGAIPKEGVACVVSGMQNALTSSSSKQKLAVVDRNSQENQELQLKKAKLTAMLDEVDRRYKLYFSQMEAVANTFETAAGLGAAKTYTILALQTISKHFHGLRDAIGSQITVASRALGEDDSSLLGQGRLCIVDQQLRHQQAVHQFGMMPQHAWRPQRGLPERSVSVLKAWLFDHFLHPYPKDADKHMLARQTGLSRNQVSNWFINARVRLWKPMIEEMYLEELKESEKDRTSASTSVDQKSNAETSDNHRNGIISMDDRAVMAVPDSGNAHRCDEVGSKNVGVIHSDKQVVSHYQSLDSSVLQHLYYQGLQTEDPRRDAALESHGSHDFRSRELNYPLYGSYLDQQEGFSRMLSGYNGVSLTLGLQHPEGVSHAGAQQQLYFSQRQNHLQSCGVTGGLFSEVTMTGSRQGLDDVDQFSIVDNVKNYEKPEEMQTRKRFASNLYSRG